MNFHNTHTTCPYCGCGCGILLEVLDGSLIGSLPVKSHPVRQGSLCLKGWSSHEFVQSDQRLTQPLLRKNGELISVSWDEALTAAAQGLRCRKKRKKWS